MAVEEIYNHVGKVVGWIDDDRILDFSTNRWIGFLRRDCVYSANGKYLGRFDGHFRTSDGSVVAFINGVQGGPLKPLQALKPLQPLKPLKPLLPLPELPHLPPIPSLHWSSLDWHSFWK